MHALHFKRPVTQHRLPRYEASLHGSSTVDAFLELALPALDESLGVFQKYAHVRILVLFLCVYVCLIFFSLLANRIRIGFVTGRRKINQCKASSHRFLQKYITVPDQKYNVPYTLYKQWYSM